VSSEQLRNVDGRTSRQGVGFLRAFSIGGRRLNSKRIVVLLLTAHCLLLTASCRQDMQDQPKYIAYRSSSFFHDGLSSRPLVDGTVARGFLRADREFYTGKKNRPGGAQSATGFQSASVIPSGHAAVSGAAQGPNPALPAGTVLYPDDVETFPFPVTAEIVNRGQERYQIFCVVCHGGTGNGDGLVVRRGFRTPPTYHSDQMRQAPVGHYFDVITNGWGAMPSHAAQIKPEDRWAIIAYIRALQLSQNPASGPSGAAPAEPAKGHSK
jgi:mono/diheme cytochrome c family protein